MYLVDTNIVSEARRGTRQAVSWLRSVDPSSVFLSALTLGELQGAPLPLRHRKQQRRWAGPPQ
ncbi:Yle-like protein (plasmid) [Sinorhizobium fredii NGR234]|uniref:Yle-like protein n=1 Tax=Sinorhizobium fredii (strain NBRC 101917 / NGR234) TaxID=394 RepID=C3KQW2_SINFN|nr:Yle-like protein [Sinorhizobium fredii NGR234]